MNESVACKRNVRFEKVGATRPGDRAYNSRHSNIQLCGQAMHAPWDARSALEWLCAWVVGCQRRLQFRAQEARQSGRGSRWIWGGCPAACSGWPSVGRKPRPALVHADGFAWGLEGGDPLGGCFDCPSNRRKLMGATIHVAWGFEVAVRRAGPSMSWRQSGVLGGYVTASELRP